MQNLLRAEEPRELDNGSTAITSEGISSNPGAVNIRPGTGEFAERVENLAGLPRDSGVFLGGVWVGDANVLLSGGADPGKWSFNSLLIVGATLDANKLVGWKGGTFGIQFLQFDGEPTNQQAGSVQGYNSLPGPEPLAWANGRFANSRPHDSSPENRTQESLPPAPN